MRSLGKKVRATPLDHAFEIYPYFLSWEIAHGTGAILKMARATLLDHAFDMYPRFLSRKNARFGWVPPPNNLRLPCTW